MALLNTGKFIVKTLFDNAAIKLLFILLCVLWFFATIGHVHAAASDSKARAPGVCVFDIDATLKCRGSAAAVAACKDAGFELAINTSRGRDKAYEEIYEGLLTAKGFSQEFIDIALNQVGSNGPFQYADNWSNNRPAEQRYQSKSYGMRNIAKYYGFKLDDYDSRKLILFDDLYSNVIQIAPDWYDPYSESRCYADQSGECYFNPGTAPRQVSFPRNWKIYSVKWIGSICSRWVSSSTAAKDAKEMINHVLTYKGADNHYDYNYEYDNPSI